MYWRNSNMTLYQYTRHYYSKASTSHGREIFFIIGIPLWRYQMETFFRITVHFARKSPVTGGFLSQRPATPSFDVLFEPRQNKRLSKPWRRRWLETPPCGLSIVCPTDCLDADQRKHPNSASLAFVRRIERSSALWHTYGQWTWLPPLTIYAGMSLMQE